MYRFSPEGYLILGLVSLICLAAFLFFFKRLKKNLNIQTVSFYKKYGLLYVILGLILMVAALIGYFSMMADIAESPGILQFISSMVSEPILIFLVSGFLIGLTLLAIGILYIRSGVSSVQTEK